MKKIFIFVITLSLALTTVILAAPGDSSDPIVVFSYLNQRINDLINDYELDTIESLQAQIEDLKKEIDSLSSDSASGGSKSNQTIEIVEIHEGEKIIAESGTELILRGGEAFIIGSDLGGITNVTTGKDFVSGMSVPANHYLIIPRSDGRGVYTNDYAIFMVRGSYDIIK